MRLINAVFEIDTKNRAYSDNFCEMQRQFLGDPTTKVHLIWIGNILSKLHLEDRTQAAVFAWREGLVQPPDDQKKDHSVRGTL